MHLYITHSYTIDNLTVPPLSLIDINRQLQSFSWSYSRGVADDIIDCNRGEYCVREFDITNSII